MRYTGTVIAVKDIRAARRFYEELFGLEVYQDYGRNITFTCGISLQQDFGWLVQLPADQIGKKPNNVELCFEEEAFDAFLEKLKGYPRLEFVTGVIEHSWGQRVIRFYDPDGHMIEVGEAMPMVIRRFLSAGLTMEEISVRMDVSVADLEKLLPQQVPEINVLEVPQKK